MAGHVRNVEPFPEKITETLSGSMLCQYFFNDRSCRTGSVGRHPDRLVAMLDSPMLSHVDGEHVEFNRSKYGHLSAPASREYGVTQECDLKKTSIRRKEVRPVEATDVCSENLSAFAEKWGDDLKNFGKRYIWQWKIPSSVYEILKKNLTWIVSGIFGTQGNIKATIKRLGNDQAIRLFSRLVAVYCAEWFKREFNGYDLENNALEDIGLIGLWRRKRLPCGQPSGMALVDVCAGRSSGKLYRAEEPE